MRSKLWDDSTHINSEVFPTLGTMMNDQLNSNENAKSREQMMDRYLKDI